MRRRAEAAERPRKEQRYMESILSPLQTDRYEYKPKLPEIYTHGLFGIPAAEGEPWVPPAA